jgi:hypothetical protein
MFDIKKESDSSMSSIFKSAAFQEFMQRRCEEIISESAPVQDINLSVVSAEGKLKETLSKSQLELFLTYEKLASNYQLTVEKTIYEGCLKDGLSAK